MMIIIGPVLVGQFRTTTRITDLRIGDKSETRKSKPRKLSQRACVSFRKGL